MKIADQGHHNRYETYLLRLFQERWSGEMRQLSWRVFSMTGNVESYLLYKQLDQDQAESSPDEEDDSMEENDSLE